MLSKALHDGLNDYGIGAKIRALRLKKRIGLVDHDAATHRPRLWRGLEYFFAGAREKPLVAVTRKSERVDLPQPSRARAAPIGSRRSITRRPRGYGRTTMRVLSSST
jgi:hypothetical protein